MGSPIEGPIKGQVGEVVTGGGTMFAQRQQPLQMLATGILLARLVGIHRQSWAQAIISRTRPSCRVERGIRAAGRVAWPFRHGTTFAQRERKTVFATLAKKVDKTALGGHKSWHTTGTNTVGGV